MQVGQAFLAGQETAQALNGLRVGALVEYGNERCWVVDKQHGGKWTFRHPQNGDGHNYVGDLKSLVVIAL